MHARTHSQARPLRLGSAEVYTGTCSWTRGFEQWYPPHLRTSSAGRLAYYASHFPAVEVDSTYYALPRPDQTVLLARRTPQGWTYPALVDRVTLTDSGFADHLLSNSSGDRYPRAECRRLRL